MPRPTTTADKIEERALLVFLAACFLLAFFKDIFPVLDKGLTAALFAGLFFTLRQISGVRQDLREAATPSESFFSTNEEFYASARAAVSAAKREICVTYFRPTPPTVLASDESREYFDEVVGFARKRGSVRRIVGVSNAALAQWCEAQAVTATSHPRYCVRVIVTTGQKVEPMSAALIDDEAMYMAFPGPTDQQLGGIREDAPKLVQFHRSRFDQLWERGTDVQDFVRSDDFHRLVNPPAA